MRALAEQTVVIPKSVGRHPKEQTVLLSAEMGI